MSWEDKQPRAQMAYQQAQLRAWRGEHLDSDSAAIKPNPGVPLESKWQRPSVERIESPPTELSELSQIKALLQQVVNVLTEGKRNG
jgi:hypothetical protein